MLVELKPGVFQPVDFSQTTLYLRWLERHERRPAEELPLGLILCAGKSAERIERLELEKNGIRVGDYLTELPPKAVLQQHLHEAVAQAQARLEQREDSES